jgi:hypothetical protein
VSSGPNEQGMDDQTRPPVASSYVGSVTGDVNRLGVAASVSVNSLAALGSSPGASGVGTIKGGGGGEGAKQRRLKAFFGMPGGGGGGGLDDAATSPLRPELRLELDPEVAMKVQPEGGSCISYKLVVDRVRPAPPKPGIPAPAPVRKSTFAFMSATGRKLSEMKLAGLGVDPNNKPASSRNLHLNAQDDVNLDGSLPKKTMVKKMDSEDDIGPNLDFSVQPITIVPDEVTGSAPGNMVSILSASLSRRQQEEAEKKKLVNATKPEAFESKSIENALPRQRAYARDDLDIEMIRQLSNKLISAGASFSSQTFKKTFSNASNLSSMQSEKALRSTTKLASPREDTTEFSDDEASESKSK